MLLAVVIYKAIKSKDLFHVFREAILISTAILIIMACGSTFSWFMATSGAAITIKNSFLLLTKNPIIVMILINIALLFLGMLMDAIAITIIFLPVFFP